VLSSEALAGKRKMSSTQESRLNDGQRVDLLPIYPSIPLKLNH
jgi:hypothetical protein